MKKLTLTLLLLPLLSLPALAQEMNQKSGSDQLNRADSEKVLQVLEDFREAIISNNSDKASRLLTDDARILESGGVETKEEYLSHHFHSDGKFLSAMESEQLSRHTNTKGNTAWVSTLSRMSGTYNQSDIRINSAELAVLVKTEEGWKISALHWSSRSKN